MFSFADMNSTIRRRMPQPRGNMKDEVNENLFFQFYHFQDPVTHG